MAYGQFVVSQNNPNNTTGGGGCVCDPRQQTDCKPPYIVCYGNEMDWYKSPHVVACARCVNEWHRALQGEVNAAGSQSDHAMPRTTDEVWDRYALRKDQEVVIEDDDFKV